MKAIAIFYQGRKQNTSEVASQLVPMLEKQGYIVRSVDIRNEKEEVLKGRPDRSILEESDLVLVLGGDGTMCWVCLGFVFTNTPIVGVNFGRVGFLTELEPEDLPDKLRYYLDGDESVWVDRRSMLHAVLEQDGQREEFMALNDVVMARGTWPRVVQIRVWIDDYFYNTTSADGMILSTATGSTAYNMAVGGPLLHPQVKSAVLTPIAPHLASDRSLILQPEAIVRLQIFTGSQHGVFSADGQMNREIKDGAIITVRKSQYEARFLRRRPPTYFYQIINAKLKGNDM